MNLKITLIICIFKKNYKLSGGSLSTFVNPFEKALKTYKKTKDDDNYIQFLIEKADINSHDKLGNTYLLYAIKYGRLDIVELLVKRGAQINNIIKNDKKYIALHAAVEEGNTNIVDFLFKYVNEIAFLDFYKFIDAVDKDGNTALHIAMNKNSLEIIKILIENGANVNVLNNIIDFNNETKSQIEDLKKNENYDELAKYLVEKRVEM